MRFETRAVHAGMRPDIETGAVSPPLHLSTTFERDERGEAFRGFGYIRESNPTQTRLEEALAAIDSGEGALVFASGMAAATAVFQSLPAGTHVILPDDCYYAVRALAAQHFAQWSLTSETVPMDQAHVVERAAAGRDGNRLLIWAETPSNPLLRIADLERLSSLAKSRGARLVVDGTFATPALQRPLEWGADVVLHSATKYLGGHTDVLGGTLAFRQRDAWFESVENLRTLTGGVASPFNAWLILRGIRTLSARMRVHSENAAAVARFLAAHPRVESVFYPGLDSHPGYAVARRQMSAGGGMLSFLVAGGRDEALAVAARTRLFVRATSLGGVESLIEHRQSSEGPGSRTPENLLRMSVGLEHAEDLIDDLSQALG